MANNKNNTLMAMTFTPEQEERFLNPAPGTAGARARDLGIDLALTLANLKLTPQQRIEKLEAMREADYLRRQEMRAKNKRNSEP